MPVTVLNPNNSGTISIALEGVTPLVDYACQITDFQIDSNTSMQAINGTYCIDGFEVPDQTKYSAVLSFLQDWGATPSLSQFAADNNKELCDFSFVPDIDGIPTVTGQLYVTAGPYGGPAGAAWLAGPITWSLKGAPTYVPAV